MTLIDQLAEAIAERIKPEIPISVAIWDAKTVAAYLNKSERQVTERYSVMPGFPKAIRLPSVGKGRAHPQWYARDIIAWAEKYQVKRAA